MKKHTITGLVLTATLLASPMVSTKGYAASNGFTDINNSYAKEAILELAEKGIVLGVGESRFNPTGALTRQDFAIVLARALNLDVSNVPEKPTFSDVSKDSYAYKYVEAAAKAGFIKGEGNGKYGGEKMLSRQDMATMFVRALGVDASGYASKLTFKDASGIAEYAKDAVGFTLNAGLIKGIGNNTFNPKGVASRQDIALVTSKFLVAKEELVKPVETPDPNPVPDQETPGGIITTPAEGDLLPKVSFILNAFLAEKNGSYDKWNEITVEKFNDLGINQITEDNLADAIGIYAFYFYQVEDQYENFEQLLANEEMASEVVEMMKLMVSSDNSFSILIEKINMIKTALVDDNWTAIDGLENQNEDVKNTLKSAYISNGNTISTLQIVEILYFASLENSSEMPVDPEGGVVAPIDETPSTEQPAGDQAAVPATIQNFTATNAAGRNIDFSWDSFSENSGYYMTWKTPDNNNGTVDYSNPGVNDTSLTWLAESKLADAASVTFTIIPITSEGILHSAKAEYTLVFDAN